MVDLVKLRKKAKGGRGAAPAGTRSEEMPTLDQPLPEVAEAAVSAEDERTVEKPTVQSPSFKTESAKPSAPDVPPATTVGVRDDKLAQFRESAGKKRQGFIEEEVETSAGDQVELLTFVIAGEQYAVSIDHIVEIVTPRTATHVPNADRSIVGIISLRGTIVTVVDVRQKLGHPPSPGSNDMRTIVAERNGETLGFEVDRVLRVLKVGSGVIEPHPVVHASEQTEAIRGVFRHANALTILLDLDKLLA
ncbi:MAG: purine-binding chemotaxis protein CheW [Thermoanaerobaculia bacterium]|jgi:purine-binding chemotaxis protein CheW|nr:purine-binding chemotaxis protein CheW [Thermoanaerobaculia bacterium]